MRKEYDFSHGIRGKFYRPSKVQKTIRLDSDIVEYFQKTATQKHLGYQTLINSTLRHVMENPSEKADIEVLKKELRKVIKVTLREELKETG